MASFHKGEDMKWNEYVLKYLSRMLSREWIIGARAKGLVEIISTADFDTLDRIERELCSLLSYITDITHKKRGYKLIQPCDRGYNKRHKKFFGSPFKGWEDFGFMDHSYFLETDVQGVKLMFVTEPYNFFSHTDLKDIDKFCETYDLNWFISWTVSSRHFPTHTIPLVFIKKKHADLLDRPGIIIDKMRK